MASGLLERQVRLLNYLTSRSAIFGETHGASDEIHLGIDDRLLRLEARFSHEKRMEKITGAFSRTFEIIGDNQAAFVRDFVEAFPASDIGRFENARQFYNFLSARWQRSFPESPHLPDVAACELACAKVCAEAQHRLLENNDEVKKAGYGVRRPPGLILLHCSYDIRKIFEVEVGTVIPPKRDTRLAISLPAGSDQPRIFELLPPIFELLGALDDWTHPELLRNALGLVDVTKDLRDNGLLEVRL